MTNDLSGLIEAARKIVPSESDKEEHRRSFAFGNTSFENSLITREMVDQEAERLAAEGYERESSAHEAR